jgi:hypothetical protein
MAKIYSKYTFIRIISAADWLAVYTVPIFKFMLNNEHKAIFQRNWMV